MQYTLASVVILLYIGTPELTFLYLTYLLPTFPDLSLSFSLSVNWAILSF